MASKTDKKRRTGYSVETQKVSNAEGVESLRIEITDHEDDYGGMALYVSPNEALKIADIIKAGAIAMKEGLK